MNPVYKYFKDMLRGIKTLLVGMRVTGYYITHQRKESVTQQYPENRETLKMFDRFRGEVVLTHNEENLHKCTGCTFCEIACPNGSIEILWDRVEDPETGKKKKQLDKFIYHLSMCTMCNLCILSCPTDAIVMGKGFEHAVFDRTKLTKTLNNPGSKIDPNVRE